MRHPSESELQQFAMGELDEARFEEVAAHVESCEQCLTFLEQTGAFPQIVASVEQTEAHRPITEGPGSVVGPYKLLQRLGEGGMGVVYMAEQEKPVRRMVALKIIKLGMDSQQVIARFEAERQALAMMDHHHIAKVLDAGTTETGRPYFAMELVKGVPITEYCDKNKLTPRKRLELFIPVCEAIQHAHQKGIIHRDIKPSNVLVTLYDGKPVPKVIDFGIAKATQQKLTERTMFTGIGQILGTFEYMSPEQAEMNQLDVDTRTDVYSLGVMLYQLLTGSTPITKEKLRNVGLEEVLRTIRETEPPKPSTRLSDSVEALPSISAVRKTEPAKLSKLVRGDLDWIVMKALEKDRTRRYETASGLAADVQRFLRDEAVEASPPSAAYRFRKFARRNKAAITTAGTIACLLIAATTSSSYLAFWALRAQKAADKNAATATSLAIAEEQARKQAEDNERAATREAAKSREVATFLKDMLKGVGPSVALGRDTVMLREILNRTEQRLSEELGDQPDVQAELRSTIGIVYADLGLHQNAEHQHREALELRRQVHGPSHATVADELHALGLQLRKQRKFAAAEAELRAGLKFRRSLSGEHHAAVAESLFEIGRTKALAWSETSAESRTQDEYDEAEQILRNAIATYQASDGDNALEEAQATLYLIQLIGAYANTLDDKEKDPFVVEMEGLLMRAVNIVKDREGNEYRSVEAEAASARGELFALRNDRANSVAQHKRAIRLLESVSEGKIKLMRALDTLAVRQKRYAAYAEAEFIYRRILREAIGLYGEESPEVSLRANKFAMFLYDNGEHEEAAELQRQHLQSRGGTAVAHGNRLWNLAFFLTSGGNDPRHSEEGAALAREAWTIQKRAGLEAAALSLGQGLCKMLCLSGDFGEAVSVLNEVRLSDGSRMWQDAAALNLLVGQQHRNPKLFEQALIVANTTEGQHRARNLEQAARAVLIDAGAPAEFRTRAVALAEEAFEISNGPRKEELGELVHSLQLCLGMARYREQKYNEATKMLDLALQSHEMPNRRLLALTFQTMSHLRLGNAELANECLDELGFFSVLPTELTKRCRFAPRSDRFAALHLQLELRALISDIDFESLSTEERIDLGLQRQARHVRNHPEDFRSSRHLAFLYAWYRRGNDHRKLVDQLLSQAEETDNVNDKYRAAVRALCMPLNDMSIAKRARHLAGEAVASVDANNLWQWTAGKLAKSQLACALAEIRLGNFEEAKSWLDKTEPIARLHRGRLLAMRSICHVGLGEIKKAKTTLKEAEARIRPAPDRGELTLELMSLEDRLIDDYHFEQSHHPWLLLQEAKAFVDAASVADPSP